MGTFTTLEPLREMLPMVLASQLLSMRLRLDSTLLRASNSQLMTCLTSTSRLRVPTALELTCLSRPLARLVKSTTTSRFADLSRQQSEYDTCMHGPDSIFKPNSAICIAKSNKNDIQEHNTKTIG